MMGIANPAFIGVILSFGLSSLAFAQVRQQEPAPIPSCLVHRGTGVLTELVIRPDGSTDSFSLGSTRARVTLHLPARRGQPMRVAFTQPLTFQAQRRYDSTVALRLVKRMTVGAGVLRLEPGTALDVVADSRRPGMATGFALVASAGRGPSYRVSVPLELPCSSLALAGQIEHVGCNRLRVPRPSVFSARSREARDVEWTAPLMIKRRLGDATGLLLPPARFRFDVRQRRHGWVRLSARGTKGGHLAGWVEQITIRRPEGHAAWAEAAIGCEHGCPRGFVPKPAEVVGLVRIRASTQVFASPGTGPWATVPVAIRATARIPASGDWIQITRIRGLREPGDALCETLQHAFVRRSAVTVLPRNKKSRPRPTRATQ